MRTTLMKSSTSILNYQNKHWQELCHTRLITSRSRLADGTTLQLVKSTKRFRTPKRATRLRHAASAEEWVSPNLFQRNFMLALSYCEISRYHVTVFDTAGYFALIETSFLFYFIGQMIVFFQHVYKSLDTIHNTSVGRLI